MKAVLKAFLLLVAGRWHPQQDGLGNAEALANGLEPEVGKEGVEWNWK